MSKKLLCIDNYISHDYYNSYDVRFGEFNPTLLENFKNCEKKKMAIRLAEEALNFVQFQESEEFDAIRLRLEVYILLPSELQELVDESFEKGRKEVAAQLRGLTHGI